MTLPALDVHLTADDADAALRTDARRGLTSTPKILTPQWLYDARGSELFEQITALPEYYPFTAEREALGLGTPATAAAGHSLADQLEAFEAQCLRAALALHGGEIKAVMDELQLPRRTLNEKMQRHGLVRADFRDED